MTSNDLALLELNIPFVPCHQSNPQPQSLCVAQNDRDHHRRIVTRPFDCFSRLKPISLIHQLSESLAQSVSPSPIIITMHSRRPPSLRHKGNRRQALQKRKEQLEGGTATPESTPTPAPTPTSAAARRKKKSSLCSSRTLVLLFVALALGAYVRFVLLSTSSMMEKGSSNLRGNSIPSPDALLKSPTDGDKKEADKKVEPPPSDAAADDKKEEEDVKKDDGDEEEADAWKNLVKEQTTKEEKAE